MAVLGSVPTWKSLIHQNHQMVESIWINSQAITGHHWKSQHHWGSKKKGNSIANISFIIFAAGIYCNKQSNHEVDQQLTINNQQSNHQLNQQPTFSPAALPPPGTAQAPGLRVFGGGSLQAQCRRRVPGVGQMGQMVQMVQMGLGDWLLKETFCPAEPCRANGGPGVTLEEVALWCDVKAGPQGSGQTFWGHNFSGKLQGHQWTSLAQL